MNEVEAQLRKQKEEIERLQKRVTDLALHVRRDPYLLAQNVFGYLALLREFYASGQGYQERLRDTLEILRTWGKNEWESSGMMGSGKFLLGLADLLEEANKPGGWPGLKNGA